jgi:ammonia channel protein AmtB
MLLGAWAFFNPASATTATDDLSQSFETTLLASVDQNDQAQ